jgi:hypothetical protein
MNITNIHYSCLYDYFIIIITDRNNFFLYNSSNSTVIQRIPERYT